MLICLTQKSNFKPQRLAKTTQFRDNITNKLLSVNGLLYLVTNSDSTLNTILVHFESRLIRVEFTIFAVFMHVLA